MKTVHLIFNAHIDPIWCWPWQSGLDEIIATCRSACDRLDAHPDLYFSKGEAWVYKKLEEVDPKLFERVRKHVESGRWEIVGGWWIQPDCNLPSGFAFEKQLVLGKAYFLDRFGMFPRVGYNVDSFGHASTLPGYLHAFGQDRYVMMRPQENEMNLPARIFRWRETQDGPEVVTFRIASAYHTSNGVTLEHLQACLSDLPPGIDHTMCFVGLGDHGGGATEKQIAWCRKHADAIEGARLVFSTPGRFFDAIAKQTSGLPLVVGEVQMHAIGCYSVHRGVKTELRKAEHLLFQADRMASEEKGLAANAFLPYAWEQVCFNHFHDTLGGTCIPSSYEQVLSQLGFARTVADEILHLGLRRKMTGLPDCKRQRMVAYNASDTLFDGYVEYEPWFDNQAWTSEFRVLNEEGETMAIQMMTAEAMNVDFPRLLLRLTIEPGKWRVLEFDLDHPNEIPPSKIEISDTTMVQRGINAWSAKEFSFKKAVLPLPTLQLIHDTSDTWSHGLDRYGEDVASTATWETTRMVDQGPIMGSIFQEGMIGSSRVRAEWRIYADEPFIELRLGVHWLEKFKILKLTWNLPGKPANRTDGVLGGSLMRPNDGKELPVQNWSLFQSGKGVATAVVSPDTYALDATSERVRLTLLRSPLLAHHEPHPGNGPRAVVADQGFHEFRFRFFHGENIIKEMLESHSLMLQRSPILADLTQGMPVRTIEKIQASKPVGIT